MAFVIVNFSLWEHNGVSVYINATSAFCTSCRKYFKTLSFPQERRCFHALPQVGTKASFGEVTTETFILTGGAEETTGLHIQMLHGFQRWWHLCKSRPQTCPLPLSKSWTAHIRNDHAKRRCPSSCLPWSKPHQRTVREAVGKQSDAFQLQTSSWVGGDVGVTNGSVSFRSAEKIVLQLTQGQGLYLLPSRSSPRPWGEMIIITPHSDRGYGRDLSCLQIYCVVPTAAVQGMAGEGGVPCHGHLLEFFTSPSVRNVHKLYLPSSRIYIKILFFFF